MNYFSDSYSIKNTDLFIHSPRDTGAVTISSSQSDFYIVISLGRHIQGYTLTGSTGIDVKTGDKLVTVYGESEEMRFRVWGFPEPSVI